MSVILKSGKKESLMKSSYFAFSFAIFFVLGSVTKAEIYYAINFFCTK